MKINMNIISKLFFLLLQFMLIVTYVANKCNSGKVFESSQIEIELLEYMSSNRGMSYWNSCRQTKGFCYWNSCHQTKECLPSIAVPKLSIVLLE